MAMILDSFIGNFIELLLGFAKEEVVMVLGVNDELQKLQTRMVMIQSILEDAEKKKFENSAINNWLSGLKDVMYDADDIVDLCRIQGAQRLADPVCCNFSSCFTSAPFRHKIGRRIKKLNDRVNQIYEDSRPFQLLEKSRKPESSITQVNTRQTSSLVDDAIVVGRQIEEATNQLVQLLISTGDIHEKCRLFAVTGMGGIGKTTLAQKILNDPTIKSQFNLRIWVCVSQNYSETGLLQQVIREAKGDYGNAKEKSELLPILQDSVGRGGGSLLLVLDDIWREDVWVDLLLVPLRNAHIKARILVTARNDDVARKMGAAHIHPVTRISVESGWEMLRMRIFSEGQEELACSLREVGLQIVEKCAGLPLAIKAVAGVLSGKDPIKEEWDRVNRSDVWSMNKLSEDLTGALYLSYEDLPSHLKQCFLYCSLFPEDYYLSRDELSKLWVAEGFVHLNSSDMLLEELAEDYFNELVRRNLLLSNNKRDLAIMHDLYHSLAQFLSRDESFYGTTNLNNSTCSSTKVRRLSLAYNDNEMEILDSVEKQGSSLRTLLASYSRVELLLKYGRLKRLSHLRVLQMKGMHVQCLPDCIGDLVHLRYLDLKGTNLTQIPKSIERLANLQFFSLNDCSSLTTLPTGITRLHNLRRLDLSDTAVRCLPDCIGDLVDLRYLDLEGTPITRIPESIERLANLQFFNLRYCMHLTTLPTRITRLHNLRYLDVSDTLLSCIPKGIGGLKKLNYLRGFVVADNMDSMMSSNLEELNSLKQLRRLNICNLEMAQSTRALILRDLPNLFELELSCSETSTGINMKEEPIEKLFNELIPPQRLEKLEIDGYFGIHYPNWMSTSSFGAYLTSLRLAHITSCTQLPTLGQLPELRFLSIRNATAVKKIEAEFLGGDVHETIAFPKLEQLEMHDMPRLKEWSFGSEVEAREYGQQDASPRLILMPCLRELSISNCTLLKQLPQGLRHSSMKILTIKNAHSLTAVDNLPTLRELCIEDCQGLSCVDKLNALQELTFIDNDMKSLPEWLLKFLQQRQLQNDNDDHFVFKLYCNRMVLRGCLEGGPYWEIIQRIPQVIVRERDVGGGLLHYTKRPHTYDINL